MKVHSLIIFTLFCLILTAGTVKEARALLFTSDMIFIGANGRSDVFKVKNITEKPLAFRIDFIQLKMNSNGSKTFVEEGETVPTLMPAEPYVFVAPRRMILQPGQTQYIRFLARRNGDMKPGEYRTYVSVSPEQIPETYNPDDAAKPPQGKQAAALNVLTGYRVPLFMLHGETSLDVTVDNIRLEPDKNDGGKIHFTIHRQGTRSALGDISVLCQTMDEQGEDTVSKLASRSVRMFTELSSLETSLNVGPEFKNCSQLSLTYTPHKQDPAFKGMPLLNLNIPR